MTNIQETILLQTLKELDNHVFINSVNSVTTQEEQLNSNIKDMEGTIAISGEWDREDLKEILSKIYNLGLQTAIEKAEQGILYYDLDKNKAEVLRQFIQNINNKRI